MAYPRPRQKAPLRRPRKEFACEHCGVSQRTAVVRVEPVRPSVPDVGVLTLCAGCVEKPERCWRLRYQLASWSLPV
jgi:hypothetical protein